LNENGRANLIRVDVAVASLENGRREIAQLAGKKISLGF